jgi:hypothetical protein
MSDDEAATDGAPKTPTPAVPENVVQLPPIGLMGGEWRFTEAGLDSHARTLFLPQPPDPRAPDFLESALTQWEQHAHSYLASLGLETVDEQMGALMKLDVNAPKSDPLGWAAMVRSGCHLTRSAMKAGNLEAAASAALATGAWHAMLVFKTQLEEAVWRGHAVAELRAALQEWERNRTNGSEEFWQALLTRRSHVLSQALSAPAFVLQGKAFIGGKAIDNSGGGVADFLMRNEATFQATPIEIKTPTTPLLTRKPYRNRSYGPSSDLVGAVAQVTGYAATLAEEQLIIRGRQPDAPFDVARAECVVIAGNAASELSDADQKRSFELYRGELRNVRIITYDELFRRIEILLGLFGGA